MQPVESLPGSLLVFDKDGVLLDFHHRWAIVTRTRAACLTEAAPDTLTVGEFEHLLGLGHGGDVLPGGLLASGSRQESVIAAATLLHRAGLAWCPARETAERAFALADTLVDFNTTSKALRGVPEALRELAKAGWRLAVATTDQTVDARRFLHLAGIDDLFVSVVGVDRVEAGKPAPDMFLLACAEADVDPAAAWMVGDLDVDLIMGRTGGCAGTIGVLAGVGDAELLAPHADHLFADVPAFAAAALNLGKR